MNLYDSDVGAVFGCFWMAMGVVFLAFLGAAAYALGWLW